MSSVSGAIPGTGESVGILAKERTVAGPGFNRWLVPPAALAIHLCIGMAYGFSRVLAADDASCIATPDAICPKDASWTTDLSTTTCNWTVPSVSFMFTLFIAFLGIAAAIWGGWLERVGPRKAGFIAAVCWCGGLVLGAVGVKTHQLWMRLARLGRARRHRSGARLHLAGVDADQMVSRIAAAWRRASRSWASAAAR